MNSVNMRSSKMKFLVYGCVICGMVLTVYLLSNTHTKLKTVKGAYDICLQQKDSLLAQLQVVYEQKSRVEKSLQKEKVDHKKTKDDYQDNIRAKLDIDKEKKDAESRYTNLQQEHQVLQDKYGQLQEKSNQLEENLRKYQTEAENLALNKDNEIKNLNGKLSSLVLSNEQLKQNYDNQAKDFAELNEKLNSLQVLNSQLLEKAQAQQNDIKNDINNNNNNNNNADADVAKESNAVADTNNNNKQVDIPKGTSPSESPQLVKQPQPNQVIHRVISPSKLAGAGVRYVNEKNPSMGYDDDPHANYHHNFNNPHNYPQGAPPPPLPYHHNGGANVPYHNLPPPQWHKMQMEVAAAALPNANAHPISPPNNFREQNINGHTNNGGHMPGIDNPGLENYNVGKDVKVSDDVEGGNSLGMEINDHKFNKVGAAMIKKSSPVDQNDDVNKGVKMIRGHILN